MALNLDADVKLYFEFIKDEVSSLVEVDIDESTSFSFNMGESDLTEPGAIETGFSYQCSLPKTQNNDQIFNHIAKYDARLYSFSAIKKNNFYLYLYGQLFQTGYFVLEEVTKSEYKIRLYGGLGELFWELSQVILGPIDPDKDKDEEKISLDFGDELDFMINESNLVSNMQATLSTTTTKFSDRVRFFMSYQGAYDNFDSEHWTQGTETDEIPECTWNDSNEEGVKVEYGNPELNENRRSFQVSSGSNVYQIRGQYVSYYQQFALRAKYIIQKIKDYALNELGWEILLHENFFNDDNPYWNDLFVGGGQLNVIETAADATIQLKDFLAYDSKRGEEYDADLGVNWMGSAHELVYAWPEDKNNKWPYADRNFKWSDETSSEYIPSLCNLGPAYESYPHINGVEVAPYPAATYSPYDDDDNYGTPFTVGLQKAFGFAENTWDEDLDAQFISESNPVVFPINITSIYNWTSDHTTKIHVVFDFLIRYGRDYVNGSGINYQYRKTFGTLGASPADWYGHFELLAGSAETGWVKDSNAYLKLVAGGDDGMTEDETGVRAYAPSRPRSSGGDTSGDHGENWRGHAFYCYKVDHSLDNDSRELLMSYCFSEESEDYKDFVFTLEGTFDVSDAINNLGKVYIAIGISQHPNYMWRNRSNKPKNHNMNFLPLIRPLKSSYIEVFDGSGGAVRSGKDLKADDFTYNLSNVTALDFLLSYCKPFNLRFLKNAIKKTVTIIPYDDFYTGEFLDYTNKVDYSQGVTQNPVLLDYCKGIFAFGGVEDKYSESYLEQTERQYGSMILKTGYDINDNEKEFFESNIFKTFVLARGYSNYYLYRYSDLSTYADNKQLAYLEDADGSGVDSSLILGFLTGGLTVDNIGDNMDGGFVITDDLTNMIDIGYMWGVPTSLTRRSTYYTLKNSIEKEGENYSLYFGEPKSLFNSLEDHSSGTIYLRYWQKYCADQLDQNTKVLKCNIIFDPFEVGWELFRKFYIINNSTWILTDISGFNPLSYGSTTCTFLRVNDIFNYTRLGDFIIQNNSDKSIVYQYSTGVNEIISIGYIGGTITLTFTYEKASVWGDWVLTEKSDEITFSPTSGGESTTVTIRVPQNTSDESQIYYFIFYWRGGLVDISIIQSAYNNEFWFDIFDSQTEEDWYLYGLDDDDPSGTEPHLITNIAPSSNPYSLTNSSQTLHFAVSTIEDTQGWTLASNDSTNFKITTKQGAIGKEYYQFDVDVTENTNTSTRSFNLSFSNVDPAFSDGLYFTQAAGTPTVVDYINIFLEYQNGEAIHQSIMYRNVQQVTSLNYSSYSTFELEFVIYKYNGYVGLDFTAYAQLEGSNNPPSWITNITATNTSAQSNITLTLTYINYEESAYLHFVSSTMGHNISLLINRVT